jgi:hypothetical protein
VAEAGDQTAVSRTTMSGSSTAFSKRASINDHRVRRPTNPYRRRNDTPPPTPSRAARKYTRRPHLSSLEEPLIPLDCTRSPDSGYYSNDFSLSSPADDWLNDSLLPHNGQNSSASPSQPPRAGRASYRWPLQNHESLRRKPVPNEAPTADHTIKRNTDELSARPSLVTRLQAFGFRSGCGVCGISISGNFVYPVSGRTSVPVERPVCQSCFVNGRLSTWLHDLDPSTFDEPGPSKSVENLASAAAAAAWQRRQSKNRNNLQVEGSSTPSISPRRSFVASRSEVTVLQPDRTHKRPESSQRSIVGASHQENKLQTRNYSKLFDRLSRNLEASSSHPSLQIEGTPQQAESPRRSFVASSPARTLNRTCVVCGDEHPVDAFSDTRLTTQCSHQNSACISCVHQWIDTQLTDQGWDRIQCLECTEIMQYSDVQRHARPEDFERYDRLAARSALANDPDFIWCQNAGCGSGQIHEGGDDMPLFVCQTCDFRYCVTHNIRWHEGETCTAFDARMGGNAEAPPARPATPGPSMTAPRRRRGRKRTIEEQQAADHELALQLSYADDSDEILPLNDPFVDSSEDESEDGPPLLRPARGFKARLRNIVRKSKSFTNRHTGPVGVDGSSSEDLDSVYDAYFEDAEDDVEAESSEQARQTRAQVRQDGIFARAMQKRLEKEEKKRERKEKEQREAAEAERKAYQKRKAQEAQGEQTVRSISKSCPKCNWQIQKNGGCDHVCSSFFSNAMILTWNQMTCLKCGEEFCYVCLADYESVRRRGNSAHKRSCSYWRA